MPVNPHPQHRPDNPTETDPWGFNDIRIDDVDALSPPPAIGESGTYQFALWRPYGADDPPVTRSERARKEQLEAYAPHAGDFETFERKDNVVKFTEETPAHFDHSLFAELEPSASNPPMAGRYGLIERVETVEPPAGGACLVEVDLLYLAPLAQYRTRQDAYRDLHFPGI